MADDEIHDRFNCVDCGVNTCEANEYYMVHDHLWIAAGMKPNGGMLCIGCLSWTRDFTDSPHLLELAECLWDYLQARLNDNEVYWPPIGENKAPGEIDGLQKKLQRAEEANARLIRRLEEHEQENKGLLHENATLSGKAASLQKALWHSEQEVKRQAAELAATRQAMVNIGADLLRLCNQPGSSTNKVLPIGGMVTG